MDSPGRFSVFRRIIASRRSRSVLLGAASVLVIAGIIFAAAALSTPKDSLPPTPAAASGPNADYKAALQAAASGDTTTATDLLKRVLRDQPDNTAAKTKLAQLESSTVTTGSNPATTPAPVAEDAYSKGVSDITSLLPKTIGGYRLSGIENDKFAAVVTAQPDYTSPDFGKIGMLQITVFDQKTPADAALFGSKVTKRVFASNSSSLKVGSFTGTFGTNGQRSASLSFARGRYAFEVIATVAQGTPASCQTRLAAIASGFAAAKK